MNTRRFAAWWVTLAAGFLAFPVHASESATAFIGAASEAVRAVVPEHGRQLDDGELSTVCGAGLEAPPPHLAPEGVAVILWDERTKVRMTDNGTGGATTGSQTINATLNQR